MVVQAEKEEGPIAKFFDFLASLLPIVIIGGLLYAGFFVKGSAVVKKVEPKAIERRDNFYSITAPTDKVAWAVGTGGKIVRSDDGGATWVRQKVSTIENLQGIAAWDAQTAVVVGNRGLAFYTTDGGKEWKSSAVPKSDNPNKLLRVRVFGDTAWAVGEFGGIFRSDDKGMTFTRVLPEKDSAFNAISFRAQTGFLVGEYREGGLSTILKSADGGATWNPVELGNRASLMAIEFRSDNDGVAVGLAGTVLTTSDGGATWTSIPDLTRENLFDVHWENGKWVAVGDKGVKITSDAEAKNWSVGKIFEGDIAWRTQFVQSGTKVYVVGANLGILEGGKLSIAGQ